jgi:hypothetical protein
MTLHVFVLEHLSTYKFEKMTFKGDIKRGHLNRTLKEDIHTGHSHRTLKQDIKTGH